MTDKMERAVAIALDVSRRRDAGEQINDEDVINENRDLSPYIEKELRKLKMLGIARSQADTASPRNAASDLRMTRVVDEMDGVEATHAILPPDAGKEKSQKIEKTKLFRPKLRPPMAMLKIIGDDSRSFVFEMLRKDSNVIGRTNGDILIEHDLLVSSHHAEIIRAKNGDLWEWRLRDLDSTNGTFVGVDGARLKNGSELLMGSEHYRFTLEANEARLEHLVARTVVDSMELSREGSWVGRDNSDQMEAFCDEFLDRKHAFIQVNRTGHWYIKNMQSVNGIWFRIDEVKLTRACVFRMGEQRFAFYE